MKKRKLMKNNCLGIAWKSRNIRYQCHHLFWRNTCRICLWHLCRIHLWFSQTVWARIFSWQQIRNGHPSRMYANLPDGNNLKSPAVEVGFFMGFWWKKSSWCWSKFFVKTWLKTAVFFPLPKWQGFTYRRYTYLLAESWQDKNNLFQAFSSSPVKPSCPLPRSRSYTLCKPKFGVK